MSSSSSSASQPTSAQLAAPPPAASPSRKRARDEKGVELAANKAPRTKADEALQRRHRVEYTCPICMCYQPEQVVVVPDCQHVFCASCLHRHFASTAVK